MLYISGRKAVEDVINTSWEIEHAPEKLERAKTKRMKILRDALEEPCLCDGVWLKMATDVLADNNIELQTFGQAMKTLLLNGRGKYRNILITGPANCGKTFLLSPLSKIFRCFQNPAATSFAWLGAEEAELIVLNDFRWTQKVSTCFQKGTPKVIPIS